MHTHTHVIEFTRTTIVSQLVLSNGTIRYANGNNSFSIYSNFGWNADDDNDGDDGAQAATMNARKMSTNRKCTSRAEENLK